jgi:hypothetical protein
MDSALESRTWRNRLFWVLAAGLASVVYGPSFLNCFRTTHLRDFVQEWASARNYREGRPVYEPQEISLAHHMGYQRRPNQRRGHDNPAGPQPAPGSSRHRDFLRSGGSGRSCGRAPSPVPIRARPCLRDLHHGHAPGHADRVGPLSPAPPLAGRAALGEPAHLGAGPVGLPVDPLFGFLLGFGRCMGTWKISSDRESNLENTPTQVHSEPEHSEPAHSLARRTEERTGGGMSSWTPPSHPPARRTNPDDRGDPTPNEPKPKLAGGGRRVVRKVVDDRDD